MSNISIQQEWSLEMYNDRTQHQGPFFRAGSMMPRQSMPMHDLPVHDLPNSPMEDSGMSRRRCNGMLRNTNERQNTAPPSGCGDSCGKWGLQGKPLAMVYSPCQLWQKAYSPDKALERGTLFEELDLPFEPSKCKRGITL